MPDERLPSHPGEVDLRFYVSEEAARLGKLILQARRAVDVAPGGAPQQLQWGAWENVRFEWATAELEAKYQTATGKRKKR